MTQLQFDLMRELPPTVEETKTRPRVWTALALLIALGLGAGLWMFLRPTPPSGTPATTDETTESGPDHPAASPPSATEPDRLSGLPSLVQSDHFVRSLVAELFGSPELDNWFAAGEELVHRGVRAILAISEKRSARRFLDFLPLAGRFEARPSANGRIIAPESYRRYDRLVDTFVSLDTERLARFIERLDPLLSQAMDENALPGTEFATTLKAAIDHLLATPVPDGELRVLAGEDGLYRFADPRFETLSPPQKQLLRLGPRNGARVRASLAALAEAMAPPLRRTE